MPAYHDILTFLLLMALILAGANWVSFPSGRVSEEEAIEEEFRDV